SLSDCRAGPVAAAWRAAGRTPDRCREGLLERLALLGRKGRIGSAGDDGLGVQPGPRPRMQAAHDEPVAREVGQGQGEALIAAGVLERVEADEPDSLDGAPTIRLEDRRPRGQLVELARDRVDLVEVSVE